MHSPPRSGAVAVRTHYIALGNFRFDSRQIYRGVAAHVDIKQFNPSHVVKFHHVVRILVVAISTRPGLRPTNVVMSDIALPPVGGFLGRSDNFRLVPAVLPHVGCRGHLLAAPGPVDPKRHRTGRSAGTRGTGQQAIAAIEDGAVGHSGRQVGESN